MLVFWSEPRDNGERKGDELDDTQTNRFNRMQEPEDLEMDLWRDDKERDFVLGEGFPCIVRDWDVRGAMFGLWSSLRLTHGGDI